MEIKIVCRYQRAINFFSQSMPNSFSFFCQLSLFQKNSNEMFSMFFEGKKHRKFYWNIFESDDLDFFLRKCWTQKIYQIQNSGYGQESLGFKILENVCFFHLLFLVDLPGCDQGRLGNSFLWSNRLTQPFSTFKMFLCSKCFDAQNISSLSTFKIFFIFFSNEIFSTLIFFRLLRKNLLEK